MGENNNKEKLINWFVQHYNGGVSVKGHKELDISFVNNLILPMKDDYIGFILNNITCDKDCFIIGGNGAGSIFPNYNRELGILFASIYISLDINEDSFYHEFGHFIDFCIDKSNVNGFSGQSSTIILPSLGCTLLDVLKKEIKVQADTIYEECFIVHEKEFDKLTYEGGYKDYLKDGDLFKEKTALCKEINKAIPRGSGLNNMNCYTKGPTQEILGKAPKAIHPQIYKYFDLVNYLFSKEKVAFRKTIFKPEMKKIFHNYNIVLDALGAFKDLRKENWGAHSKSYYKRDISNLSLEFFANMFAADIVGFKTPLDICERLLPTSFAAYYELIECMKEKYKK